MESISISGSQPTNSSTKGPTELEDPDVITTNQQTMSPPHVVL